MSESEEKLSWDFPRFLELAVRKGRVLLVIDGVHRLRTETGDAKLNWLPLRYPGNVRVILSATTEGSTNVSVIAPPPALASTPTNSSGNNNNQKAITNGLSDEAEFSLYSGGGAITTTKDTGNLLLDDSSSLNGANAAGGKRNRILMELERRRWQTHFMPAHVKPKVAMAFVKDFILLSARSDVRGTNTFTETMGPPGMGLVAAARPPEELDGTAGTFSLTAVAASEEDEEARRNELQKKKAHLQVTAMEAGELPGLSLFPSQYETMLDTPACSNPLFLDVLLHALRWSARRGFDLQKLLEEWLECSSAVEMYSKILDCWENGQEAPSADREEECRE